MSQQRTPGLPAQSQSTQPIDVNDPRIKDSIDRYWRKNIAIMLVLLAIWAIAGLGCGILFADHLNAYKLGGFPLGFWFAQQGSIIVFVLVILVYCILLNRLDAHHHDELTRLRSENARDSENAQGNQNANAQKNSLSNGGDI